MVNTVYICVHFGLVPSIWLWIETCCWKTMPEIWVKLGAVFSLQSLLAKQPATPTRGATVSVLTSLQLVDYLSPFSVNCIKFPSWYWSRSHSWFLCFRSLQDGQRRRLPGLLVELANPPWPVAHQWLQSKSLTLTWKVGALSGHIFLLLYWFQNTLSSYTVI